jgi:cell division protein FtsI (penicillin-binding protein 3)
MWDTYRRVGFGEVTSSGYPGESAGSLSDYRGWNKIERATLAFGYGLSVTALQLAQAYAVLANDGLRPEITILTRDGVPEFQRVLSVKTSRRIRKMLEGVVSKEGTAVRARVEGYRVAGKTGTVHKSTSGGYAKNRYISVFAGFAPATHPRLVVVVTINEPHSGEYYGGIVAAPVFSKVMTGALRLLDVPPDNLPALQAHSDDRAGAA